MKQFLSSLFIKPLPPRPNVDLPFLDNLDKEVRVYLDSLPSTQSKTILYGHSFSIYEPSFIHDRIISNALRLRGARIIPFFCDGIQMKECNVFGGHWLGKASFREKCRYCQECSRNLWKHSPTPPLLISSYLEPNEVRTVKDLINNKTKEWKQTVYEGLPIGAWAYDILANNYLVNNTSLIPNANVLGKVHAINLILLSIGYRRIIKNTKPDIIISNDSFYGMWGVLQALAREMSIPFYSHWVGIKPTSWCYAQNDAAMNLNIRPAWKAFSKKTLTIQQRDKVDKWFRTRRSGKQMILDTASLAEFKNEIVDLTTFNPNKPTALLSANVVWDLAALHKEIIFPTMIEWISHTISWFAHHPEFQLIVKPHPAELHPTLPSTREQVIEMLKDKSVVIPSNVFMIPPKAKITLYDLLPKVQVGLVHTTTAGLEMAYAGIPVLTTAKAPYRGFGFTIDPETKEDYFRFLNQILSGTVLINPKNTNLYHYILLYFYHYCINIDILSTHFGEKTVIKIKGIKDILPGKNNYIDWVCDRIISGEPIISECIWPPESLI